MNRLFLILGSFLFIHNAYSQLIDNFSDGDFSANPTWKSASVTDFTVVSGQLKSANTNPNSNFYISTSNLLASHCTWEFMVKLSFATSGTNYVDAYLIANDSNLLSKNIQGYFVRIGNTTDEISLYKMNAGLSTKIIDGIDKSIVSSSNNLVKVKVTRNNFYEFILERDLTGLGSNYIREGFITDSSFTSSTAFGFVVKQSTASFFGKHTFDDIRISPIIEDVVPPSVLSVTVLTSTQLDVLFSERLDKLSAENATNYLVNNAIGNPSNAILDIQNPSLVHLTFLKPFENASVNTLTVSGVQDLSLNAILNDTIRFTYLAPITLGFKDIIINELFPDPSPVINLPTTEFVELYNRSNHSFNLSVLTLSDSYITNGTSLGDYTMLPNSYVIICPISDTAQFSVLGYKNTLGVNSFPSLNNTGDYIYLKTTEGVLIDSVNYEDTWYQDAVKKNGGYTLELINPNLNVNCSSIHNWKASTSPQGGTPGFVNSIYSVLPDLTAPSISSSNIIDSLHVSICFDEDIALSQLSNPLNYSITEIGVPTKIISQNSCVTLTLPRTLVSNIRYTLSAFGIKDCSGNAIKSSSLEFVLPDKPKPNDVVINEILFDPFTGGVDFVELYNRSQKTINLKDLRIGSMDTLTNVLFDTKKITDKDYLLLPEQYIVLSENGSSIKQNYASINPKGFLDVVDLPSMNVDDDVVTLSDDRLNVIDNFKYSSKMHFPLLTSTKGVSLERINFNRLSNDKTNWNSASEGVGFATPAYQNSQYLKSSGNDGIAISNPLFSPDNDGYFDVLDISYKLEESGQVANVYIYDNKGRTVRHLIKNEQLSAEGQLSWNGITDTNEKAPIGIYVVYVEIFKLSGKVNSYKLSCTLAGKL